jgi:hypothetical protein
MPSGDPWVTLAAIAQATARLKLVTFPYPRRCSVMRMPCLGRKVMRGSSSTG